MSPSHVAKVPAATETMISPWKTRQERSKDRDLKREAVLRMAVKAFNEQGFHKTSLDDVAERLNVSKPTIYYYFKNKDDILVECVRIGLNRLDIASSKPDLATGTGLERLVTLWTEYARIVSEDFGRCLILIGEDPLPPETRKELRAHKRVISLRFRALVEQAIADGSMRDIDPRLADYACIGALSWIARWHNPKGSLGIDEIARQMIDLLIHGVGAGKAT